MPEAAPDTNAARVLRRLSHGVAGGTGFVVKFTIRRKVVLAGAEVMYQANDAVAVRSLLGL